MQTKRTSKLQLNWKEYPGGLDIVDGVKRKDFTFSLLAGKLGDEKNKVATAHVIFNHSTRVAHIEITKCPESDEDSFDYHPKAKQIIQMLHANLAKSIVNKVDHVSNWHVLAKGEYAKSHFENLDLTSEEKVPLLEYHEHVQI